MLVGEWKFGVTYWGCLKEVKGILRIGRRLERTACEGRVFVERGVGGRSSRGIWKRWFDG